MTYSTRTEAIYKTLRDDDALQALLGTTFDDDEAIVDPRVYNGWPEGEIALDVLRPAYVILTDEGDVTTGLAYGVSELYQVRIVSLARDLREDIKERIRELIIDNFTFIDESKYESGRIQLTGGGRPSSGPGEYDTDSRCYIVNVRFTIESVKI